MGMRVPGGIHRDAGAEIEIALARRRRQPAAVAPLERQVGPHVSRHDRRWYDFGRHGSPPELSAGALWGRAKTKTPPRGDGFLCQLIQGNGGTGQFARAKSKKIFMGPQSRRFSRTALMA